MASTKSNDAQILQLLRAGQRDKAFDVLFHAYRDKLHHLCAAYMHDPARAEDVLQESLLRIWRFLPKYNGRASLYTWIYAIARNLCRTELRCQPNEVPLEMDNDEGVAMGLAGNGANPEDLVTEMSECARLRSMVDLLPEKSRRVLLLFYYEDRSVHEVARMLAMREANVKTHLFRARRALGKQLRRRDVRPKEKRSVEVNR